MPAIQYGIPEKRGIAGLDSLDLSAIIILDCGACGNCAFGGHSGDLCSGVDDMALTMRCLLAALARRACCFLLIRSDRVVAFCMRRDDLVPGCGALVIVVRMRHVSLVVLGVSGRRSPNHVPCGRFFVP